MALEEFDSEEGPFIAPDDNEYIPGPTVIESKNETQNESL